MGGVFSSYDYELLHIKGKKLSGKCPKSKETYRCDLSSLIRFKNGD
jgi:hypothetical protein